MSLNIVDIIIIVVIAVAVGFAVYRVISNRHCSTGGCSSCTYCNSCKKNKK